MFGLAACDERGPGFCQRKRTDFTDARHVGMRMQSKSTGTHRHARVDADNTCETTERPETLGTPSSPRMEEQLREDEQELKTREQKKKAKDAKRIRGTIHENHAPR